MDEKIFPNRLRLSREAKGLTQKELAAGISIGYQTYNHYETGRNEPDLSTVVLLAKYLNVSLDYLLGRTNDPSPITQKKIPSYQEEVIQELEDITPEMASEIRLYISYLKHKKEAAANIAAGKK